MPIDFDSDLPLNPFKRVFSLEDELEMMDAARPDKDKDNRKSAARKIYEVTKLMEVYERKLAEAGTSKWFVDGTTTDISNCPRHRAFFEAGAVYHERLFMAGNRPLVAGTKVRTPDGYHKNIEDLKEGDKVLAYQLSTNSLVEAKVTKTYHYNEPAFTYSNGKGVSVSSTPDHEFLYVSGKGVLRQDKAERLAGKVDRKVVVPCKWDVEEKDPGFSEREALLLGLLTGDGHLCARNSQFKFTNKAKELVDLAVALGTELGTQPRVVNSGTFYDVYFPKPKKGKGKSTLFLLLERTNLLGTKSGNKTVPQSLFCAPVGHIKAYLHGLLATDGYSRLGRYCLSTTSALLAEGVVSLCLRLGIRATVATRNRKDPNHADEIVVSITGDDNLKVIGNVPTKPYKLRGGRGRAEVQAVSFTKAEALGNKDVYCITIDHPDHLFVANGLVTSNCGKSISGAFETACHLTGLYPEWWVGKRFDHPISAWAAGQTGQTTRDTCQKELLGPPGALGTGMIPKELILGTAVKQGVANAIELVKVRHVSGGVSVLGFKSYDQGVKAFYGTAQHVIWLDEECPDLIYNECLIRTMTTGGILYVTFTPLHGITPFIVNFCKNANFLAGASPVTIMTDEEEEEQLGIGNKASRAVVQAGWDHAPWLDEDTKKRLEDNTPPHLREARRNGTPSIGSGNVYPIPVEEIVVDDFTIPGHWPKWYGLDVGWNRTAAVWLAKNPDDGSIYVYSEHYRGQAEPEVHAAALKSRGDWIRGCIDPASKGRSQVDGRKLIDVYRKLGLKLVEANNAVEGGIQNVWSLLSSGKLKVFKSCVNLLKEYMVYRRDLQGRIVKDNDHALDALRYGINTDNVAMVQPTNTARHYGAASALGGIRYDT